MQVRLRWLLAHLKKNACKYNANDTNDWAFSLSIGAFCEFGQSSIGYRYEKSVLQSLLSLLSYFATSSDRRSMLGRFVALVLPSGGPTSQDKSHQALLQPGTFFNEGTDTKKSCDRFHDGSHTTYSDIHKGLRKKIIKRLLAQCGRAAQSSTEQLESKPSFIAFKRPSDHRKVALLYGLDSIQTVNLNPI